MPLTTISTTQVALVSAFTFGGTSGKKRKMATFVLNDPLATSGGMTVGGAQGDIPASAFGFTKIESCSSIQLYTTATLAPVGGFTAAPDKAGTSIMIVDGSIGTVADATIATTQSVQLTLIGY